jgi:hypothetical protein
MPRWLIRWTDFRTFRDYETIVNADSREEAEAVAGERRMSVTFVGPVDEEGDPVVELSVFGQPVAAPQVVSLMMCGLATIGVLLQSLGMLSNRIWVPF